MNRTTGILTIVATLVASEAFAACEIPAPVESIPDGATASEQELLAVQTEIKAYVEAMDGYIACENEQLQTRGDNAAAEFLYLISARIDSARKEVDTIASRFNDEVSAFRAASEPPAAFPPQ